MPIERSCLVISDCLRRKPFVILSVMHYLDTMQTLSRPSLSRIAVIALVVFAAALLLATLAGWSMFGTSILFTYAQNGLAWCF